MDEVDNRRLKSNSGPSRVTYVTHRDAHQRLSLAVGNASAQPPRH